MTKAQTKLGRPPTTRGYPKLVIRIPPELHKKILDCATKEYTSINSQVLRILRDSFDKRSKA